MTALAPRKAAIKAVPAIWTLCDDANWVAQLDMSLGLCALYKDTTRMSNCKHETIDGMHVTPCFEVKWRPWELGLASSANASCGLDTRQLARDFTKTTVQANTHFNSTVAGRLSYSRGPS